VKINKIPTMAIFKIKLGLKIDWKTIPATIAIRVFVPSFLIMASLLFGESYKSPILIF